MRVREPEPIVNPQRGPLGRFPAVFEDLFYEPYEILLVATHAQESEFLLLTAADTYPDVFRVGGANLKELAFVRDTQAKIYQEVGFNTKIRHINREMVDRMDTKLCPLVIIHARL